MASSQTTHGKLADGSRLATPVPCRSTTGRPQTVYRVKHRDRFTILENLSIELLARNPEALGLWTYLMKHPDDYVFDRAALQRATGLGRDKLRDLIRYLEGVRLARRRKVRNLNRTFAGNELVIFETPQLCAAAHQQPELFGMAEWEPVKAMAGEGPNLWTDSDHPCFQAKRPATDFPATASQSLESRHWKPVALQYKQGPTTQDRKTSTNSNNIAGASDGVSGDGDVGDVGSTNQDEIREILKGAGVLSPNLGLLASTPGLTPELAKRTVAYAESHAKSNVAGFIATLIKDGTSIELPSQRDELSPETPGAQLEVAKAERAWDAMSNDEKRDVLNWLLANNARFQAHITIIQGRGGKVLDDPDIRAAAIAVVKSRGEEIELGPEHDVDDAGVQNVRAGT